MLPRGKDVESISQSCNKLEDRQTVWETEIVVHCLQSVRMRYVYNNKCEKGSEREGRKREREMRERGRERERGEEERESERERERERERENNPR